MGVKLGNTDINKLYLGNEDVDKIYLGGNLIFNTISDVRPSIVNSYNAVSNTNDVTVTAMPMSGNYLVAQLALGNFSSSPTAPVGWTKVHETTNSFGAHAFFVKESDGTETSITFSKSGGNGQILMASIHEFSNVNDATPYEDLQGGARTQRATIDIPSLTSTNTFSLAVSFITALNINDVDDNLTSGASDYSISNEYSSNMGQGAWNLLLLQDCEDVVLPSDSISFSQSAVYSTLSFVLSA